MIEPISCGEGLSDADKMIIDCIDNEKPISKALLEHRNLFLKCCKEHGKDAL